MQSLRSCNSGRGAIAIRKKINRQIETQVRHGPDVSVFSAMWDALNAIARGIRRAIADYVTGRA